jgi:3-oxoacyl-[acyl-carrier-protein] synthase II
VKRVVVTGFAPLTPIGVGNEAFHQAQLEGRSGIRRIQGFDVSEFPCQIAGEMDIDLSQWLDRRELKRMDRISHFAVVAAILAIEHSQLDLDAVDKSRVGTLVGTGIGGLNTWERVVRWGKGAHRSHPLFIPLLIPNMPSSHVAMRFGFMGPSFTITTACTTGNDAIGSAVHTLERGDADVMLAGGTEASITYMGIGAFGAMRALSSRNDCPEKASRPFSASRDGFVMGEGAGVLVLETLEHAEARGATIHAEIVGFGRSSDAYHITEPHPTGEGAVLSMRAALRDAGLEPEAIDYVNAHGTSTLLNDKVETLAVKRVFGDHAYKLAISSTKSMVGHLIGAAGAIEGIACIQAMQSQIVPPTINYFDPDPELDLDYVPNQARERKVDYALSNSFGFGGHNASVIYKRVEK